MSSGNLQVGTRQIGTPSFITQGQVDWIAFGNTIWQASSAVLQRFASAGIQPITYGAALALANEFRLSPVGRRRMDEALSKLRGEYGFEKVLFFGFGYQSFVTTMTETQLAVNSIALCACLCQTHGVEFSAHILAELWKESGFPNQYEPSHTQFVLLIEECAGTLAKSTFDDTVDLMLGDELKLGNGTDSTGKFVFGHRMRASDPSDIAKVLHILFKISVGIIEKITVVGGAECAFVAAFAEWALGLKTQVKSGNGDLIFTSAGDDAAAQVIISYQSETPKASMELTGIVHYLREPTDMFVVTHGPKPDLIIRTPWSKCLSRTFGSSFGSFGRLMESSDLLSSYLGSGARIYKALATGEVYEGDLPRSWDGADFTSFVETSYGQGFVNTALTTFPELAKPHFLEGMQQAADSNLTDAVKSAHLAFENLRPLCPCPICKEDLSADDIGFCLRRLATTIFKMVVHLGCAKWDQDLRPAVSGFLDFFSWIGLNSLNTLSPEGASHVDNLLSIASTISNGQFLSLSAGVSPFQTAFHTALSRNGICYYLEALRSLSSKAEAVRLVHILPGHIQKDDRRFDSVQDGERWFSYIPASETQTWNSPNYPPPLDAGDIEVRAMALERAKDPALRF